MLITDFLQMIKQRNEPPWSGKKRIEAFMKFIQLKMPNPKEEEWRFTDISKINLDNITNFDKTGEILIDANNQLTALPMKDALNRFTNIDEHSFSLTSDSDKFDIFVSSFWDNGAFVYVPKSVNVENPVTLKIRNSNKPVYTLIILEENSSLNLIEENISSLNKQTIATNLTEIIINENAKLNFFSYQSLPENFYNFHHKIAAVERNGEINWFIGSFGSILSRFKIETLLKGENSKCQNYVVFSGNKNQHHDLITKTFHLVPHTLNNILVKGAQTDQSSSIYRGLIRIEKPAQQTLSYMGAHTLLLSEKSKSNNIPSLEIEANDVRATHGSSVGQIDEEKLFYIMSRGLDRKQSENVIVEGFLETVLNKFPLEEVKEKFRSIINEKLWYNA